MTSHSSLTSSAPVVGRRALLAGTAAIFLAGCAKAAPSPAPTSPEAQTAAVDTRFGTMTVPRSPRRVVSTYDTSADFAWVLGLPLVGLGGYGPSGRDLPEYQRSLGLGDLPKLSTFPELDIENVLRLDPDLVLDDFALDETQAKKVSGAVALFSFAEEPGAEVDWRALLRQMGSVFGAEAKAEAHIAAYDARVSDIKNRLQSRWAGAKFAYVGPYGNGNYYVAQANMVTNEVLHRDLGLAFAEAVPPDVASRDIDVSMEKLDELNDADLLLLRTNPKEDGTGVDTEVTAGFEKSPLWQRLPAVKKNQSYLIPGALFYTSPLTPAANLDWVEANLLS